MTTKNIHITTDEMIIFSELLVAIPNNKAEEVHLNAFITAYLCDLNTLREAKITTVKDLELHISPYQ